jgi:hypothetical protein
MIACAGGVRADDFYQNQLRAGTAAYQAKQFLDAVAQLRIASFGLLDEPVLLSETLARLALAQAATDRAADLKETLSRFILVEQKYGAYPKAALDAESKSAFEALLRKNLAPDSLASIPSLASLASPRADYSTLSPRERRRALESQAQKNPNDPRWSLALAREAAERADWSSTLRWASRVTEIDSANRDALVLRARAHGARHEYAALLVDAKALPDEIWSAQPDLAADRFVALVETGDVNGAKAAAANLPDKLRARGDVARAMKKLAARAPKQPTVELPPSAASEPSRSATPKLQVREAENRSRNSFTTDSSDEVLARSRKMIASGHAADAERLIYAAIRKESDRRDLRLAFLEAASLAGDWRSAAAQIPLIEPFGGDEQVSMFYAAASLFEMGHPNEAKTYLNRALPSLSPGPMVDLYSQKILGEKRQN